MIKELTDLQCSSNKIINFTFQNMFRKYSHGKHASIKMRFQKNTFLIKYVFNKIHYR